MKTTTDPYDETPLPPEGVLSEKETATQLREDSCRQYVERIRKLEEQLEGVSFSLMTANRKLDSAKASIHAAHGLLSPLGNQVTPSVMTIREALQILRGA